MGPLQVSPQMGAIVAGCLASWAYLWHLNDGQGVAVPAGVLAQQLQAPGLGSPPGALRQPDHTTYLSDMACQAQSLVRAEAAEWATVAAALPVTHCHWGCLKPQTASMALPCCLPACLPPALGRAQQRHAPQAHTACAWGPW